MHGCNHVEYTEEEEAVETRLKGFPQYPFVYVQALRAWEGAVLGDASFSIPLPFLVHL